VTENHIRLQSLLINTRNEKVTRDLKRIYQSRTTGGDLRVFCVSNTTYWSHREVPREEGSDYLLLSNIIAVRSYCIALVAQSQLRAATKYIRDRVPALLGSIELWVQSGSGNFGAERRQAIRKGVDEIERRFERASPITGVVLS
jgi:hypothetical protein